MTRIASLSNDGSTPLAIFTLLILPSFSTINETMTLPCMPFSSATTGYLRWLEMKDINPPEPPGYDGICSAVSWMVLSALDVDEVEVEVEAGVSTFCWVVACVLVG
jgi:hypothetical protein